MLRASLFGRTVPSRITACRNASVGGNDFDYTDVVSRFKWDLPEKFNFAQDVIDARGDSLVHGGDLAFHHVSSVRETKWSYADISTKSKQCASALSSLGQLRRAVTILPKVPEWWLLNVAAMRTGTILLPGTTLLTASDIAHRLEKAEADVVIGDLDVARKVEEGGKLPSHLKHKLLVTDAPDSDTREFVNRGWIPFRELLAQNGPNIVPPRETPASEIIQIYFTSGTTGSPKMVPHTQASYGFCHWVTGKYWLDLTSSDLHWNVADTGWAKSAWSSVFAPWSQGAGVFVHGMSRFTPKEVLQVLDKYPITTLCAPPTLYRAMVLEDLSKYSFSNLRHCLSAGEPLNEEVILTWEASTGHLIKEGYGQTETTLLAGTFKGIEVRPGSMGKAAPGYDIRIVNSMGQEVPTNTQGNIGVRCHPERPPGLFEKYLDSPERTQYAFAGDFYLTGDRASMDEDGYIWFAARDDDIIISAGYRIGPFEVESALLEHPAVAESAVIASPDLVRGQVVKAVVVLREAFKKSAKDKGFAHRLAEELQEFVKKKTAPYKYPRKVEFVDALPKTVSGKIKRAELRSKEKA